MARTIAQDEGWVNDLSIMAAQLRDLDTRGNALAKTAANAALPASADPAALLGLDRDYLAKAKDLIGNLSNILNDAAAAAAPFQLPQIKAVLASGADDATKLASIQAICEAAVGESPRKILDEIAAPDVRGWR